MPWRKRAFGPGTKYFFFRPIFGRSWGLVCGEGGRPWYGTSAQPESHFTCSSPRCAPRVAPTWWTFRPRKKIFSPPPPKFPNSPQTPSRPLGPSPSWRNRPPPLLEFQKKKIRPPPSRRLRLPFPLSEQKKIKNIQTSSKPSTFLLNSFCAFLESLGRGEGAPLVRYLCKSRRSLHGRHVWEMLIHHWRWEGCQSVRGNFSLQWLG